MKQIAPQAENDQNRAAALLAIIWVPYSFTTAIVLARYFVRRTLKSLGRDDYLMFIAWLLYTVYGVVETFYIANGGTRNPLSLDPKEQSTLIKLNYIGNPFVISSITLSKCSVGFLLLRILKTVSVWRKWIIYILLGVFFASCVELCGVLLGQCVPASSTWKVPKEAGSRCLDARVVDASSYFQSSYGSFVDVVLALFPVTIIWGMNMGLRKKITISVLMGLGLLAAICAAIKTKELALGNEGAGQSEGVNFNVIAWSFAEIHIVLICGSIPAIKPLYDQLFRGKPMKDRLSSTNRRYPNQRTYTRHTNLADIPTNPIDSVAPTSTAESGSIDHISAKSTRGLIGQHTFELEDLKNDAKLPRR